MAASLATLLAATISVIVFAPLPGRAVRRARQRQVAEADLRSASDRLDSAPNGSAAGSGLTIPISPMSPTSPTSPPSPTSPNPPALPADPESTSFPVAEYLAALATVRSAVCILDTFPLPHTLLPAYREAYLHGLRTALEAGATVEVLLLHARSTVISDRVGPNLGRLITPQRYQQHIHRAMAELHTLREALAPVHRPALQIRLTDAFPGITCYQLDDRVLTAFYPPDRLASQAPHAWVPQESAIGKFARRRFTNLWDHAEPLDLPHHLFCELRLPTPDPAGHHPVYPRTRFVERGKRLYVCFDSRTLRDRAFDEHYLYARLPDPGPQASEPVRYSVAKVRGAMVRTIEEDLEAKYPDVECSWGIGELLEAR